MTDGITQAVVYLSGAQVTRTRKFKLEGGVTKAIFGDLPYGINGRSVTASSDGKCVILSVAHSNVYEGTDSERISEMYAKLEELKDKLGLENGMLNVLKEEEVLIRENSKMNDRKVLRPGDMKDTAEFFRERMVAICKEKLEYQKRISRLSHEIAGIESEIGYGRRGNMRSKAELEVHCNNGTESEITVSYFVSNAGWTPCYDIRAKDAESPLSLAQKATVYQNTGEDWNNVSVILSTGNPSLGGDIPDLEPWYIDTYEPYVPMASPVFRSAPSKRSKAMECGEEEVLMEAICSDYEVPAAPAENMTGAEYTLSAPYTILSSADGRSVDIAVHELSAKYVYKSVRKMEKDVFLAAEIGGWEHLNLLAGKANIFFEDKYVGEISLDPGKVTDTLRISLGRDKNIVVTRERGKDHTASAMGSVTRSTREWTLTAKNLRKQKIDLIIEDQVPVSVNKAVTVDILEISDAEHDKDKGKLTWSFSLEPAGSRTMQMRYRVTFPKNKSVMLE
jgi:uncharacterized protein (TIGR02231 family)